MTTNIFDTLGNLPGVGKKTLNNLQTLGLFTQFDLLYYFPYRYDDLQELPLDAVVDGQKVVLKGLVVTDPVVGRFGYRKTRLTFKLKIDHDVIMVSFFNQPWLKKQLELGQEIAVYGKYNEPKQMLTGMKVMATKDQQNELAPIYSVNQHVKQKKITELVNLVLQNFPVLENVVPEFLRVKYHLLNETQIVVGMHRPKTMQISQLALRSAIFREFFLFQMQLQSTVQEASDETGVAKNYDESALTELANLLSFELSQDQKVVVREILADLKNPRVMNRLLQGDVGSGKTVVAVFAIFAVITAGYQAALMVPTEILAQQHYQKISALLGRVGVFVALITGSTSSAEKKQIYAGLKSGAINCVIGTHALIQDQVEFAKLGLIIIDEQHRFGVGQRATLRGKGDHPDVLAMTATPIPRTLALTVYGNMDISIIKTLPHGRLPIKSEWKTSGQLADVFLQMREQLEQGFQIYVVTPLIQESEQLDVENATDIFEKMSTQFGQHNHVALLHGQMKADEKEHIMAQFVAHQIDILVTTSVIEVGVDVQNANMMVIFDADRFGLSQLHQLRGRIGRGETQSYCVFIADPKTKSGKKRMDVVANTTDGFVLAEEDLKLRGEGDLFGTKQSGLPEFKVGDVVTNFNTLVEAKKSAKLVLEQDPTLSNPEYQFLKQVLEYKNQDFEG